VGATDGSDPLSLVVACLGLALGLYLLIRAVRDLWSERFGEGVAASKVAGMAAGEVALSGKAWPLDPMVDPIYGKPCSFCRITVTQDDQEVELVKHWRRPFWLEDETGRVLVDPDGAQTRYRETLDVAAGRLPRSHPVERYVSGVPGIGPEGWRLRAEILRAGSAFHLLGRAVPLELRELSRLLKSDPERMKAIDLDKDGAVDPDEWDVALYKRLQELTAPPPGGAAVPVLIVRKTPETALLLCDEGAPTPSGRGWFGASALIRCLRAAAALAVVLFSLRILSARLTAAPAERSLEAAVEERSVHLTSPRDSERAPKGGEEDRPPSFPSPVRFTWVAPAPDAQYSWTLEVVDALGRPRGTILKDVTAARDMELSLPRSLPGERYVFKLEAYEAGKRVGAVKMRVGRGRRGDFSFQVR
jgi:hypothetical protein